MKTSRDSAARALPQEWDVEEVAPPVSSASATSSLINFDGILDSRRALVPLITVAGFLVTAHLTLLVITLVTGHDWLFGLVRLFDLDREFNVPSFFSGSLFLFNGLLFWLVGQVPAQRRRFTAWYFLSGLFVFLAYDELFSVHEQLTGPVRATLHTTGLLYYAWMIVYAVPVIALTVWFLPTWRRLESVARTWLMASAALYLFGAIVMEMFEGAYVEMFGAGRSLAGGLLVAAEESLEMAGLLVLVHALLLLIKPAVRPSL